MMIKSKTEDLEIFVTVVDCGSFTGAANLLDTQVAKISRAVSRLERNLGTTLFTRSTRRVELTEAGLIFLSFARDGLEIINRGEEALNTLQGAPKGKLRIDAASPFLFHQIIPYIEDFQLAYPDIQLNLISNENIVDLIEKKTDLAIRIGKLSDSNLYAKNIGISKLHIVASPRYFAKFKKPATIAELRTHKLIGFADSPKLNNWFLKEDMPLTPTITASNGESIRQLALNGNGIALLSNFMVRKDLDNNALVEVLPNSVVSPNPREEVHAVYYKNSAATSRITAFMNFYTNKFKL
ncbi:LysR family transcriptional regulator [Paraglaciecola arctica]|uniref:LysR family transcriptional regulator n=1 Tax=Paraglaciecola arctica TaxID=1128911 RepID=UPI001C064B14|nr:LysR family transcriptional regulator [Paraglaciecola arctica]MBU3004733.1 LysR family transcriptional regulator [Paraglaciecola arctica]